MSEKYHLIGAMINDGVIVHYDQIWDHIDIHKVSDDLGGGKVEWLRSFTWPKAPRMRRPRLQDVFDLADRFGVDREKFLLLCTPVK